MSVSQEMDDALADVSDLISSLARKHVVASTENATKQVGSIGKQAYDTSKCMARTTGKKQCQRKRARNSEFCQQHRKSAALGTLPHGRCDTPLLADGAATKSKRSRIDKTKKLLLYCRLTMWSYAAQLGVDNLAELSDEQYDACLKETHEYLRKHPSYVTSWKLQSNEGPASCAERHTMGHRDQRHNELRRQTALHQSVLEEAKQGTTTSQQ